MVLQITKVLYFVSSFFDCEDQRFRSSEM